MVDFNTCFNKLTLYSAHLFSAHLFIGVSLILPSYAIAPIPGVNESFEQPSGQKIEQSWGNQIRLAQAQFTTSQLPSDLANSSELQYGDRVRGRLGVGSMRHQGRLFAVYHFQGEADQLVRINLVGESASNRTPDRISTGSLLINPAVILLDQNDEIVAQQPEQTDAANALIRMNLPMTGTYKILVTSTTVGSGGRYTLALKQIEQNR